MLARSGLLAILVLSTCAAGPWEFRWAHPTPEGNAVHAFAFPTAARGYAVGLFGAVLRTDDGGASWERLDPVLQGPHLYDVVALDHSTLVAVGQGIFRSTDGGESFVQILDATAGPLRDVALVPGGALTAAGAAGRVWHSTDGGLEWVDVGPGTGEIRRHTWTSTTTGFVVGDAVAMRTSDGGQSWSSFIDVPAFGFNDVFFTDALTGYVLEDFGYASTIDGGDTWEFDNAFVEPIYRFFTLALDANHWYLTSFLEGGELYETLDAGETWENLDSNRTLGFLSVALTPGGRLVWGVDDGEIRYSDDGGETVQSAQIDLADSPTAPIVAFFDRGDGTIFAADQPSSGGNDMWIRSDDDGRTWYAPAQTPGLHWARAGAFATPLVGVVASYEDVRYTDDGGDTWSSATLPAGERAYEAAALASDRIFLGTFNAAGGGHLYLSVDGGASWAPHGVGLPSQLSVGGIAFTTSDDIWLAGSVNTAKRLYRSTDGGDTWIELAATGLGGPADDLWIAPDGLRGIAAVRTGTTPGLFHTSDGGTSWTLASAGRARRVSVRSDGVAVACGSFSSDVPRVSLDGGLGWEPLEPPLAEPFEIFAPQIPAILNTDAGLLVGASKSRILFGEPLEIVSAPAGGASGPPAPLALAAPRPNPSAEGVTASFTLQERADVSVTVHDVSGRMQDVLVQETRAAGTHTVAWDGRRSDGAQVAPGVYFLRLAVGDRTVARKVVRFR